MSEGFEAPIRGWLMWLAVVAVIAAFAYLGRMDIVADNEGQRAVPPIEMLRSGDYVMPTINGAPYLAKPPLLYWVIAGVYGATGWIAPWSARLPVALCYAAMAFVLYAWCRANHNSRLGLYAGFIWLASPYAFERGHVAQLDVPLTLAAFLAVIALRTACRDPRPKRRVTAAVLSGAALGAAVMLKGPAPLIFVWAAWVAVSLSDGDEAPAGLRIGLAGSGALFVLELLQEGAAWLAPSIGLLRAPIALVGLAVLWTVLALRYGGWLRARYVLTFGVTLLIAGLLALPWALAVLHRVGGGYVDALLHEQVVERTHTASAINSGSPFYYALALPVLLAPWGLLLPIQASRTQWRAQPEFYRFCLCAGWLSVLAYSLIAGKEYEYILPAFPLLLTGVAFHLTEGRAGVMKWAAEAWFGLWRDVAPWLVLAAALGGAVYASIWKMQHPILLVHAWTVTLVGAAVLYVVWHRPRRRTLAAGCLVLALLITHTLGRAEHYRGARSFKRIAALTGDLVRGGAPIEAVKMTHAFDVFPAFAFYARIEVPTTTDLEAVRAKLGAPAPYYCVLRQEYLDRLYPDPKQAVILEGPCTSKRLVLIGNAPLPQGIGP